MDKLPKTAGRYDFHPLKVKNKGNAFLIEGLYRLFLTFSHLLKDFIFHQVSGSAPEGCLFRKSLHFLSGLFPLFPAKPPAVAKPYTSSLFKPPLLNAPKIPESPSTRWFVPFFHVFDSLYYDYYFILLIFIYLY